MARKAYRFNNPAIRLVDALQENFNKGSRATAEGVAFVEVRPAVNPSAPLLPSNAYGGAVNVPEWVREDQMFKWALAEHDVIIVPAPAPAEVKRTAQDVAGIAATLSAAEALAVVSDGRVINTGLGIAADIATGEAIASAATKSNPILGGQLTDIAHAPEAATAHKSKSKRAMA